MEDFVDKVIARSDAEDAGCGSLSYKVLTSATSWISLQMSTIFDSVRSTQRRSEQINVFLVLTLIRRNVLREWISDV